MQLHAMLQRWRDLIRLFSGALRASRRIGAIYIMSRVTYSVCCERGRIRSPNCSLLTLRYPAWPLCKHAYTEESNSKRARHRREYCTSPLVSAFLARVSDLLADKIVRANLKDLNSNYFSFEDIDIAFQVHGPPLVDSALHLHKQT